MEESTFQKVMIAALVIIIGGLYTSIVMTSTTLSETKQVITEGNKCGFLVDVIAEQCSEENHVNLTSIKGNNKELFYENGVCVIR